jgi:hypothetical protein
MANFLFLKIQFFPIFHHFFIIGNLFSHEWLNPIPCGWGRIWLLKLWTGIDWLRKLFSIFVHVNTLLFTVNNILSQLRTLWFRWILIFLLFSYFIPESLLLEPGIAHSMGKSIVPHTVPTLAPNPPPPPQSTPPIPTQHSRQYNFLISSPPFLRFKFPMLNDILRLSPINIHHEITKLIYTGWKFQ